MLSHKERTRQMMDSLAFEDDQARTPAEPAPCRAGVGESDELRCEERHDKVPVEAVESIRPLHDKDEKDKGSHGQDDNANQAVAETPLNLPPINSASQDNARAKVTPHDWEPLTFDSLCEITKS